MPYIDPVWLTGGSWDQRMPRRIEERPFADYYAQRQQMIDSLPSGQQRAPAGISERPFADYYAQRQQMIDSLPSGQQRAPAGISERPFADYARSREELDLLQWAKSMQRQQGGR